MQETKQRISSAIDRARADLEEALFELEKLPAVSEDAVGFAAHALNNFLTVTGGTVELLGIALQDHPDPKVSKWLDALRRSTDHMTHTVGQLRSASIGRESDITLDKIDLVALTTRFVEFYQSLANRKQILCVFEPEQKEAVVWTDGVMTAVVLDNLLSNAVKYSPQGGRISISVAAEPDGVVCRVRDEGPGLAPDEQAKLFQRGVRLTPKPTGGEPSTGYGLAVSKEFLDKLDGTIWCESAVGEGSCFCFRLPHHQEHLHGPGRKDPSGSV